MVTTSPLASNGQKIPPPEKVQENGKQTCSGSVKAVGVGDICPICQAGRLDYDGMLNLACPKCGSIVNTGGTFT